MRLRIHVTPRSRANEIRASRSDGIVRVRVTEVPEDGRANRAVLALLSDRLGLPKGALAVAGGGSSRQKWIEVEGLEEAEVWRRLEAQP